MKKYIILVFIYFIVTESLAQHKTLTVYYPGDSTNVVDLTNTDSLVIFICGVSKVNYGGKNYNTVLIGNQCWLKENLDVGEMIPGTSNQLDNSILEKYCYNNNSENCTTYGGLYQWNEAMQYVTTEGTKGICPDGWHIPTLVEFQTLSATIGNEGLALLTIEQGGGTNTSGFSGLLSGYRNLNNDFVALGVKVYFWSSIEFSNLRANNMRLYYNNNNIFYYDLEKTYGFVVRCLKD